MKSSIILLALLGFCISASFALHAVKKPHPFVLDTGFLKEARNGRGPKHLSLADLSAFLQKEFRDTTKVQDFFATLRKRLTDERTEHQGILDQQRNQCQDEETFRNQAVAEGTDALSRSQAQFGLCTSEKTEAIGLRDLADNALIVYRKQRENLESDRQKQKEQHDTRRQRLVDVEGQIDKALEFMQELETEAGGVKAAQFVQITNGLLRASLLTGHSHMVLPVYTKLLQMHTSQDSEADDVQQVRSLLEQLRQNAQDAIAELDHQEEKDQQDYDTEHKRLSDLITRLDKQSADSRTYIVSMEACIAQETSLSEMAAHKVERNQDLLEQSRTLCRLTEEEFTQAEGARTRQQNMVNTLEAAVSKVMKDYEGDKAPDAEKLIMPKLL